MKHIYVQKIHVTMYEKLQIYFKTKVMGGNFVMNFLMVSDIDVHQLNLRPFRNLEILVENSLKKCVFWHFLSNRCIINSYFWEETITLKKRKDFIGGHYIVFSFFFGLVMCHEPQTWGLMAIKKMYVIYFMHIDFIQFSSSNHWIKLNFDS